MGQGRRPTLKSAAHDAACVPGVVRQPEQPPRCWAASPKRKVGGAVGSATGALLALTAPRRVARLGYVPWAQLRRGGWWYRCLEGEQGASEAAQPDLSSNIVTDRCCVQV